MGINELIFNEKSIDEIAQELELPTELFIAYLKEIVDDYEKKHGLIKTPTSMLYEVAVDLHDEFKNVNDEIDDIGSRIDYKTKAADQIRKTSSVLIDITKATSAANHTTVIHNNVSVKNEVEIQISKLLPYICSDCRQLIIKKIPSLQLNDLK